MNIIDLSWKTAWWEPGGNLAQQIVFLVGPIYPWLISDFITPISEDGQQTWEVTFFFLMLFYYNVSTNAYCLAGSRLGRRSKNRRPIIKFSAWTYQENGIRSFPFSRSGFSLLLMPELNEGFRLRIFSKAYWTDCYIRLYLPDLRALFIGLTAIPFTIAVIESVEEEEPTKRSYLLR